MAEGNMNVGMSEAEVKELKEALCAQQQLLQKLHTELDVEREASATAISEALSMILRLQDEKSAVVMEASQYKRMTEEKISHAEESIVAFEELMYQKEMEIAALEFLVQAYKCKILSMGCSDVCISENIYQENLLMPRNEGSNREIGSNSHVRRLKSLPALPPPKDSNQNRGSIRKLTPEPDMVVRIVEEEANEQNLDSKNSSANSEAGDLDSYWYQIRKLDERVKEITDRLMNLTAESRKSSLRSQLSTGSLLDQRKSMIITELEQIRESKMPMEKEAFADSACSSSVYDVFEVPPVGENGKSCSKEEKGQNKWISEEEDRLGKPDLFIEETSDVKDENNLGKKLLLSINHEKGLSRARDRTSIECNLSLVHPEISINQLQPESKQFTRRADRYDLERHHSRNSIVTEREEKSNTLNTLNTSAADHQLEIQQLSQRIERLESDRNSTKHEIFAEEGEELSLLREIREQLNSIQSEMRSPKQPPNVDSSLQSIQEIFDDNIGFYPQSMLYFWL